MPVELLHLRWLSVHCLCIRLTKQALEDKQCPERIDELALRRSSPRRLSAVMQVYKHLLCHTQDVCCPALESEGPLVRGGGVRRRWTDAEETAGGQREHRQELDGRVERGQVVYLH